MAIMAALALAGIGVNLAEEFAAAKEAKFQSRLHRQELAQQARISRSMFDLNFPNLVQQQRANRGQIATHAAKGNVAGESVSVLALLSEQARVDSVNQSLAIFQQHIDQQGFAFGRKQAKRDIKHTKQNLVFQALKSGVKAGSILASS